MIVVSSITSSQQCGSLPAEIHYYPAGPAKWVDTLEVMQQPDKGLIQKMDACMDSCWKAVKNFCIRLFRFLTCCCTARRAYTFPELKMESLFQEDEVEAMQENWNGLGKKKWMEAISGKYHEHGKYVFDEGLHGETVEPGYFASLKENVFPLIEKYLGTRTTPEFFLEVHKAGCWHFDGDLTDTLMGPEKIGVFRGEEDHIVCEHSADEHEDTDRIEFLAFKPSLGTLEWTDETKTTLRRRFTIFSQEQIRQIMAMILDDFYKTIGPEGLSQRKKIRACAKLCKEIIWLHPPRDGRTRTCLLILQKHLTEYVGHPAILEDSYMMAQKGLESLTDYLEKALACWEREKASTRDCSLISP